MNDRTKAIAALGVTGTIIVGSAASYINTVRVERAKRKHIQEREIENLAVIRQARARLQVLFNSDASLEECMNAFREEMAYIRIVTDQPYY